MKFFKKYKISLIRIIRILTSIKIIDTKTQYLRTSAVLIYKTYLLAKNCIIRFEYHYSRNMPLHSNNSNNDVIVNLSLNLFTHIYNNNWIQIIEGGNKIQMDILKFPKRFQCVICGVLWLLILLGSKFRYVLYCLLYTSDAADE